MVMSSAQGHDVDQSRVIAGPDATAV